MEVRYIGHHGDDLLVVNAARVSFNKKSNYEYFQHSKIGGSTGKINPEYFPGVGETSTNIYEKVLSDKDKKLINYLAKHGHWTPMAHPQISLHFKVPIFAARQIHKHQVGFVVNEVSRRYVDEEPEWYMPEQWRAKAEDKKQGSADFVDRYTNSTYEFLVDELCGKVRYLYKDMLEDGIAPEQARMVLPLSTYTEFWMTGSLAAWARLYNLRIQPDAQKEVQEVARQIGEIVEPLYPVSWSALVE